MAKPDPLNVRAYNAALERHRNAAIREARNLKEIVDTIAKDLAARGRANTGDGRRALHTAGDLMERLVALEALRQDAEHFTVDFEE